MAAPLDETPDERLIQSTLAGDDEAFAALVRRYQGRVFAIARRFARNDNELEDLAQEVFVKAYQNLAQFRADAPLEHWLSRICVRCCYDFLRRSHHDRATVALDNIEVPVTDNLAPEQAREVLDFALSRIRADERLVITLLELEGRSVREIAALTGWSEGNVKVRAHRARQRLKAILEAHHER